MSEQEHSIVIEHKGGEYLVPADALVPYLFEVGDRIRRRAEEVRQAEETARQAALRVLEMRAELFGTIRALWNPSEVLDAAGYAVDAGKGKAL